MNAEEIVARLTREGKTAAFAESLTGGLVTDLLVRVPGASACVRGGAVTYQDEIKEKILHVSGRVLGEYTAVSAPVARQMALGARELFEADYAVSTTGYAGPQGAQVGQVFISVASPRGVKTREFLLRGSRNTIRKDAALIAVSLLGGELLYGEGQQDQKG